MMFIFIQSYLENIIVIVSHYWLPIWLHKDVFGYYWLQIIDFGLLKGGWLWKTLLHIGFILRPVF